MRIAMVCTRFPLSFALCGYLLGPGQNTALAIAAANVPAFMRITPRIFKSERDEFVEAASDGSDRFSYYS